MSIYVSLKQDRQPGPRNLPNLVHYLRVRTSGGILTFGTNLNLSFAEADKYARDLLDTGDPYIDGIEEIAIVGYVPDVPMTERCPRIVAVYLPGLALDAEIVQARERVHSYARRAAAEV